MTKTERALLNDAARIISMSYGDGYADVDIWDQAEDWLRAYKQYSKFKASATRMLAKHKKSLQRLAAR